MGQQPWAFIGWVFFFLFYKSKLCKCVLVVWGFGQQKSKDVYIQRPRECGQSFWQLKIDVNEGHQQLPGRIVPCWLGERPLKLEYHSRWTSMSPRKGGAKILISKTTTDVKISLISQNIFHLRQCWLHTKRLPNERELLHHLPCNCILWNHSWFLVYIKSRWDPSPISHKQ